MIQVVEKRSSWCLTKYGWIVIGGLLLLGGALLANGLPAFLSYQNPVFTKTVVISGTLPDAALERIVGEFGDDPGILILTIGGPITRGSRLSSYRNYADLGAAALEKIAGHDARIIAIPSSPTQRDRVYESALALRDWINSVGTDIESINVYTIGVRGRRTQILFDAAFNNDIEVGIISIKDPSYDSANWWSTSQGFRTVTSEFIAYTYTKLFFWPT